MEKKPKIVQFQEHANGHVLILLDNGRVFRKQERGGPWYWTEEEWVDETIAYFGLSKIL